MDSQTLQDIRSEIEQHTIYVRWVGNLSLPVEEPYITIADLNDILEKYSSKKESPK